MDQQDYNSPDQPFNDQSPQNEPPQDQPPIIEQNDFEVDPTARNWAVFCHLAAFLAIFGVPFGNIIGPLVVWLIKKSQYPYIDDQGKESLNFQITMSLAALICFPLIVVFGLGLVLLIAVAIFDFVMVIVASVKSSEGIKYRYPATLRLIS